MLHYPLTLKIECLFKEHKISYTKRELGKLSAMRTDEERLRFMQEHHKIFRNDFRHYTFYIKYYLEPWFESLRQVGRLQKGNTTHFK